MATRNLFLCGSIDLNTIFPKVTITDLNPEIAKQARLARNGHIYLSVVCSNKKEVSQYGQSHDMRVSDRDTKRNTFIGDFKDFTKDNNNFTQQPAAQAAPQTQSYQQPNAQAQSANSQVDTDGLPF